MLVVKHIILAVATITIMAVQVHAADDMADWQRYRDTAFADFRVNHPGLDSQIAQVKTKSALMIAAYKQSKLPALRTTIAKTLSVDKSAQALNFFSTGYTLWQSGDFASSEDAFRQGLALDPSNGMANFYMGDIEKRKGDEYKNDKFADFHHEQYMPFFQRAAIFFKKAIELSPSSIESFKARTALREIPMIETNPELSSPPVILSASTSPLQVWDDETAPIMTIVPAGEYTMGRIPEWIEGGRLRKRIFIENTFAVSTYPITVGEYSRFILETHYSNKDDGYHDCVWNRPGFQQNPNHPVTCISYDEAAAYAKWISNKTQKNYRLLTESEYEYAERAGSETDYWWGDDENSVCNFENVFDLDSHNAKKYPNIVVNCHDRFSFTSPVGSFKANKFGLFDMSGNVKTWVSDCASDPDMQDRTTTSTKNDECDDRVIRGGSWEAYRSEFKSFDRDETWHFRRSNTRGFRLARVL